MQYKDKDLLLASIKAAFWFRTNKSDPVINGSDELIEILEKRNLGIFCTASAAVASATLLVFATLGFLPTSTVIISSAVLAFSAIATIGLLISKAVAYYNAPPPSYYSTVMHTQNPLSFLTPPPYYPISRLN
jgi:hypothetical protein